MGCCCGKKAIGGRYHGGVDLSGGSKTHEQMRQEILAYNLTHSVHQILDQADFEEQLKNAGSKLVVVDFFATWCGPCKRIGPEFEKMAGTMTDVIFLKVDVDHLEEVAAEYNVSIMPTFVFILEGKQVGEISGGNAEKLKNFIDEKNKLPRENLPTAPKAEASNPPSNQPGENN